MSLTTTARPTAVDSARFAMFVAKVELVATLSDPTRPLGVVGAALAVSAAGLVLQLGGPVVAAGTLVGGLVVWLGLVWVVTRVEESRGCLRAQMLWRYRDGQGLAAAVHVWDESTGGWLVQSVAAHPRGRGSGSRLMRLICVEADREQIVVSLVAVTARVAGWYETLGFVRVRRTGLLRQWRLERRPSGNSADVRPLS